MKGTYIPSSIGWGSFGFSDFVIEYLVNNSSEIIQTPELDLLPFGLLFVGNGWGIGHLVINKILKEGLKKIHIPHFLYTAVPTIIVSLMQFNQYLNSLFTSF